MTVNIITPEGGSKTYVILIALRNEIIGNIIFKDKKDVDDFKQNYAPLQEIGYGHMQLNIDTQGDNENE